MTVTTTNKGRWRKFVSDVSTTDDVITELTQALNDNNIHGTRVVFFDVTNKTAVAEIGG